MRLQVIKEHSDYASRLRLGDIVEVRPLELNEEIVNIGGAHYWVTELSLYFEKIRD